LTPLQRVGAIAVALLLPCCGGVALIGAFGDDPAKTQPLADPVAEQLAGDPTEQPAEAEAEAIEPPASEPAPTEPPAEAETEAETATTAPAQPSVTRKTVTERQSIPFSTRTVKDSSLPQGETKVRTKGVKGTKTLTYEVTSSGGTETGRKLVRTVVSQKPVTKVVAVGTKKKSGGNCHASYSPCVPIASDVDCEGGGGNGPAYVDGPIRVTGSDEYDLDRDGDGIACD
jgi:hypothetical protein